MTDKITIRYSTGQMTFNSPDCLLEIDNQKLKKLVFKPIFEFPIDAFLSDIFGVSGRNLIRVLIRQGRIFSSDVENETKRISKEKKADIIRAINGQLTKKQRDFLQLQITMLDGLLAHLETIEKPIYQRTDMRMRLGCS